jgi:hypothetical protein
MGELKLTSYIKEEGAIYLERKMRKRKKRIKRIKRANYKKVENNSEKNTRKIENCSFFL